MRSSHDAATALVLRSSLRVAQRDGDVVFAGRAIARLRIDGAGVAAADLIAARLARAERDARDTAERDAPAVSTSRQGSRLVLVRALVACAALLLAALLPAALVPSESPEGAAPAAAPLGTLERPTLGSRGRSTAMLPPVVVAQMEPVPTAAAVAEPEPLAAPAAATVAAAAPVAHAGLPGGVVGGVPGGVVGGTVGGTGIGNGTASPVPTPIAPPAAAPAAAPAAGPVAVLRPGPIQPGYSRLTLQVVDARNGQPIAGACVIVGTGTCGPTKPQTNAQGLWWLDYPRESARSWDISVIDPRFRTYTTRIITGEADQTVRIRLKP